MTAGLPGAPASTTTPKVNPSAAVVPSSAPSRSSQPAKGGKTGAGGSHCATASPSGSTSDWATLRLAPDQAWAKSKGKGKGKGQMVAVLDSGADGSVPSLIGHLSEGMDIVGGSGRGDTDCLGTGTAMAGLIAGQKNGGGSEGVAPDATVMPVRIVGTGTKPRPADSASAITASVAAGATVIALGSYVDVNNADVAKAVNDAIAHDVVVVAGAALSSVPVLVLRIRRLMREDVDNDGHDDQVSGVSPRSAVEPVPEKGT